MKREKILTHLTAALMAWGLSVCAVGCLVSGFHLDSVDMSRVILLCGCISLLGSGCFYWKWGTLALLCAGALACGFLWRDGNLWTQTQALVLRISRIYDNAYGWGRPALNVPAGTGMDGPLALLGTLAALGICWTMTRRKNVFCAIIPVLLPLVACLVVTDTVPSEGYLFGWLLGVILLLLTDWVRRNGPSRDVWLTAGLALPVAAALAALFLMVPQEGYVNRAPEFQGRMVTWAERFQSVVREVEASARSGFSGNERVNLESLGPRVQWNYSVMKVTSSQGGAVYLRGRDYNTYSGSGWIASENRVEDFSVGTEASGTVRVHTYGVKSVRYIPYYPAEALTLTGGCVENDSRSEEYSFSVSAEAEAVKTTADTHYSQLPAGTLRWARELADGITARETTIQGKARAIGDYVRSSADYDLNTGRMSRDYDDFAQWFLERSNTGYCVHFATAATVLLRAAGIPARYVEGYLVICEAGEETLVTGRMAHAWTEYWDNGVWRVLEATPAVGQEAETAPEETTATQPVAETQPLDAPAETETVRPERPQDQTPSDSASQSPKKELPGWLKTTAAALLWAVLAAAAVWGQSTLRISRKRAAWCRGEPNRQALARWAQVSQLALALKVPVPGELEALAQKARFSQHTLTGEELRRFDEFRRTAWESAAPVGAVRRVLLRLIYAVE